MTTISTDLAVSTNPLSPSISSSEERTLAILVHLSILLSLCTGWLGMLAALIVYLVYQERSRYIGFHALQSLFFQLTAWIVPAVVVILLWVTSFALLFFFGLGLLLMPIALLASLMLAIIPLLSAIYGIIGAVECSAGRDFQYWMVGPWAKNILYGGKQNADEKNMGGTAGSR